jgi:hypothetical protein
MEVVCLILRPVERLAGLPLALAPKATKPLAYARLLP